MTQARMQFAKIDLFCGWFCLRIECWHANGRALHCRIVIFIWTFIIVLLGHIRAESGVFVFYFDSSGRRSSWRRLWSLCSLAWLIWKVPCRVSFWNWKTSMTDSHGEWELQIFPDKLAVDLSLYWRGCFEFRPSVLDNFALLSGQLNTINKVLKNEKTPSYRSQVIIPLLLSPDRDEELVVSVFTESLCLWRCNWLFKMLLLLFQKLTEQRVPVFSHEIVPDHLRTKPDPEVEEQEKHLSAEAARIGPEVAQVNKHMSLLYLT